MIILDITFDMWFEPFSDYSKQGNNCQGFYPEARYEEMNGGFKRNNF